jgi:cytochrome P450
VPIIVDEVKRTLENDVFRSPSTSSATIEAVKLGAEITICTAAATLQGREVREGLDKSFAGLYHDLDGGFTPLNMIAPYLPLPNNRRRDAAQAKMRSFYMDIIKKRRESGNQVRFELFLFSCVYAADMAAFYDRVGRVRHDPCAAGPGVQGRTGAERQRNCAHGKSNHSPALLLDRCR